MKLFINRFWSEETKTQFRNEDYTLNRYIVVNNEESDDFTIDQFNYLKEISIDNSRYVPGEGYIGGFVARQLKATFLMLPNTVELLNKKITVYDTVKYIDSSTSEEVFETETKGIFYVTNSEVKDTSGETTITAYDAAAKFDVTYVSNIEFPCTAKQLLKDACACCDMSDILPPDNQLTFTNMDFVIENNQYVSEVTVDSTTNKLQSATCRLVLQDIAKLAFSYLYINNDGKLEFRDWNNVVEETIDTNHYYTCKSEKPAVIEYNAVVLAMRGIDGENVVVKKPGTNGDKPYYIYDNNLTYTPDLRTLALSAIDWDDSDVWDAIFPIYTPLTIDLPGYPWIENMAVVTVTDVDEDIITTPIFDSVETYKGYLTQTASSKIEDKQKSGNESYANSEQALINQTRLIVDKANGEINFVRSNTYTKNEIKEIANGEFDEVQVTYVQNEQGKFSGEGLRIERTDPDTGAIVSASSSLFNEIGLTVQRVENQQVVAGKPVLFAGYVEEGTAIGEEFPDYRNQSITATNNIIIDNFAVFGNQSRIETFEDEDGIVKTGMFDIGGN